MTRPLLADARAFLARARGDVPRLPRPSRALLAAVAGGLAVQRLALPGTQIPVLLLLAMAGIVVGLHRGSLSFDAPRLRLYLVAVVAVVASTLIALVRGFDPSLPAVLLLLAIYACGTVVLTAPTWAGYRTFLTAFVQVMTWYAALGAVLFAAQWIGIGYRDWLGSVVPDSFLLDDYHTTNPLVWGSEYSRANGVVFLEPSLFSLFTGLALATGLYLRVDYLRLGILFTALVTTVSGNGMVVFGAAVVVLAVTGQWRSLRPLLVPVVLGGIAVAAFSLGPTLLARVTEVNSGDSSANLRFVQPYTLFAQELVIDPVNLLLGRGAGAADDFVATVRSADLQAPVIPKILFEYGLLAAVPLLALLCALFLSRVPTWVLGAGLALVYWGINASLLVPLLPLTLFAFVTLWGSLPRSRPRTGPDLDPGRATAPLNG